METNDTVPESSEEVVVSIEESDPELHRLLVWWCKTKEEKRNPFILANGKVFAKTPRGIVEVRFKTQPNEPCPCGSGKKFKKCCG